MDSSLKYSLTTSQSTAMQLAGLLQQYFGKEIVLFCVGNAKIWYDCFAPLLAEMLRMDNANNFYIYGGINFCITAENIEMYINFVKAKHPSACVIVVDNCLTLDESECGTIKISKRSTNIAGLAGGYLFGDISIMLATCPTANCFGFLKMLQRILPQVVLGIEQAINNTTILNLVYNKNLKSCKNIAFVCKKHQ